MSHFTVKAFPTVQTHVFIISRVFTHHSCDTLTVSQVLYRSGATTHLIHAEKNKAIANSIIAFAWTCQGNNRWDFPRATSSLNANRKVIADFVTHCEDYPSVGNRHNDVRVIFQSWSGEEEGGDLQWVGPGEHCDFDEHLLLCFLNRLWEIRMAAQRHWIHHAILLAVFVLVGLQCGARSAGSTCEIEYPVFFLPFD